MYTPARSAAWRMVSPGRASMFLPSSVKGTVRGLPRYCGFAAMLLSASLEFLRKIFYRTSQGVGRRLAQTADGGVDYHLRELLQQIEVPVLPLHQFHRLGGAHPAGRALATGLVLEEAHGVQGGGAGAVLVREDDDRRGADEAAVGVQRVKIQWNVAETCGQDAAGGPAGKVAVKFVTGQHAAAVFVDQLADGDARGCQVHAGLVDAAAD